MNIYAYNLNSTKSEASQNLWHKRLAHMNGKRLSTMTKKKLINVPKDVVLIIVVTFCLVSYIKSHSIPFSSRRLELLYSDAL